MILNWLIAVSGTLGSFRSIEVPVHFTFEILVAAEMTLMTPAKYLYTRLYFTMLLLIFPGISL